MTKSEREHSHHAPKARAISAAESLFGFFEVHRDAQADAPLQGRARIALAKARRRISRTDHSIAGFIALGANGRRKPDCGSRQIRERWSGCDRCRLLCAGPCEPTNRCRTKLEFRRAELSDSFGSPELRFLPGLQVEPRACCRGPPLIVSRSMSASVSSTLVGFSRRGGFAKAVALLLRRGGNPGRPRGSDELPPPPAEPELRAASQVVRAAAISSAVWQRASGVFAIMRRQRSTSAWGASGRSS